MLTKEKKFLIAIGVQLIIIFTIIIFKVATLTGGTEVLLRIEPVDPTDPLRGDYITFQYTISSLNNYLFKYSPIRSGDTIYIPLRQLGNYWTATYDIKKTKPLDDKIFIQGKVSRVSGSRVTVIYGIEEYFIPEGAGRGFRFRGHELAALVSVDENGNAVLKQIYMDNKPWP